LRPSIPRILALVIAIAGVIGLVLIAVETNTGAAPGSGQGTFDAPGCQPKVYDGPGRAPHYLLARNCPTPTPVIIRHSSRSRRAWNLALDGSQSFDPAGGQLVKFAWTVDGGSPISGMKISVHELRSGLHAITLYVTGDSGLTGTQTQVLRLG
jgi:hypothetical protein